MFIEPSMRIFYRLLKQRRKTFYSSIADQEKGKLINKISSLVNKQRIKIKDITN